MLARALQNAQKLFGYDAVVFSFDPPLEAEACGCSINWGKESDLPSVPRLIDLQAVAQTDISDIEKRGRLPVVLEAARRLKVLLGRTVAQVGAVTGPLTLATCLSGVGIEKLGEGSEEVKGVLRLAGQVTLRVCKAYCELEQALKCPLAYVFKVSHLR